MRQTLIQIDCGERTCAPEPGVFCRYVRVRKLGTVFSCHLFESPLKDEQGWLMRCEKCLETFKDDVS